MKTHKIRLGKKLATGIEIKLPNGILVLAKGKKGFVMCGYLDVKTAEKLGDRAAVVRGVKKVEDLLNAKIVAATSKAKGSGIKPGMTGKEALSKLV